MEVLARIKLHILFLLQVSLSYFQSLIRSLLHLMHIEHSPYLLRPF